MDYFDKQTLEAHNFYRSLHHTPPLVWNGGLAREAQAWAERLAREGRLKHSKANEGENIFMLFGQNDITGSEAVDKWYGEVKNYNFARPGFQSNTGHFTQVVWKGSKEFGVGKAQSADGKIFVVGRYRPAGNNMRLFDDNVIPTKKDSLSSRQNKPEPSDPIINDRDPVISPEPPIEKDPVIKRREPSGRSNDYRDRWEANRKSRESFEWWESLNKDPNKESNQGYKPRDPIGRKGTRNKAQESIKKWEQASTNSTPPERWDPVSNEREFNGKQSNGSEFTHKEITGVRGRQSFEECFKKFEGTDYQAKPRPKSDPIDYQEKKRPISSNFTHYEVKSRQMVDFNSYQAKPRRENETRRPLSSDFTNYEAKLRQTESNSYQAEPRQMPESSRYQEKFRPGNAKKIITTFTDGPRKTVVSAITVTLKGNEGCVPSKKSTNSPSGRDSSSTLQSFPRDMRAVVNVEEMPIVEKREPRGYREDSSSTLQSFPRDTRAVVNEEMPIVEKREPRGYKEDPFAGDEWQRGKSRSQHEDTVDGRNRSNHHSSPLESLQPFQRQALDAHNYLRAFHGEQNLKWSSELASSAQSWADKLAKEKMLKHYKRGHGDDGENIAMLSGKFETAAEEATNMWYEEVENYDFRNPGYQPNTGHFTQVVWKNTREFGIARAQSSDGRLAFVVARYRPAGNVIRMFEENVSPQEF